MIKTLTLLGALLLIILSDAKAEAATDALLKRISNGTAKNIKTVVAPSGDGRDFFEISGMGKKIVITGSDDVCVAAGLNWYLKYTAGIHISWNNLSQDFPARLPLPAEPFRAETDIKHRYYLNFCTFSYSMAFWDWERWERELDWMALHGVNLVLDIVGNEMVWYNLLTRAGYSPREIGEFIAGPAFQAWWQMNNLEGWGGPNPDEYYKRQYELQLKILARMRELGIEPVFPGYAGMVPRNIGEKLGYDIADPGKWCSFDRPAFLQPENKDFDSFADMYYREMEKLYGKANYYAIDPFHEGGNTKGVDLDKAGKTIMAAMKRANPTAIWVAQAWHANPRDAMIGGLEQGDMLVLDLNCDSNPQWGDKDSQWYREHGFGKHDWAYCMLLNFGGRPGMHGRMEKVINGYYDARSHPNGRTLTGVGATPEGIENNPVMFELLFELPWRPERFAYGPWAGEYVKARYGRGDPDVAEAWDLLSSVVYDYPRNVRMQGGVESVFCARPGFNIKRTSTWGSASLFYDPEVTRRAARLMLDAADRFGGNDNFEYDLVDIVRQAIADRGNVLMQRFSKAFEEKDAEAFEKYSGLFMEALHAQDKLLGTRREFSLSTWLDDARKMSDNQEYKKWYEWNARTLISTWGPRDAADRGGLHDYSWREWSGLLSGLYAKRWQLFFDAKREELRGSQPAKIDFFAMEEEWAKGEERPAPVGSDRMKNISDAYETVFGKQ